MTDLLKRGFKGTNKTLLLLCFTLSSIGIIAVSSATHSSVADGSFFSRDAKVMLIAVLAGAVLSLVISFFDYELIQKLWIVVGVVSIGLMLVLFTPLGCAPSGRDDSRCWIKITSSLYFQPSEIVKIGFVITFAAHCEKVRENLDIKNIAFLCAHGLVYIGLVVLSGDMGSALIFIMMFIAMLFTAGAHWVYFIIGPLLVAAVLPVAWYKVFGNIQRNRILALFYPDLYPNEIYQQNLAEKAMQNGGLTGTGLFNGVYSKTVPECQNDMVLSVIGEEFGFIGAVLLMLVFVLLIIRIMRIGRKSNNYGARIMCSGIAFMIGSQVMVNIGMCTKLLPVIGITLPFISAGGSSSLCIYIAIGLILSISRHSGEVPVSDFIYRGRY